MGLDTLNTLVSVVGSIGFPIIVWWVVNKQLESLQMEMIKMQKDQSKIDQDVAIAINNNTNAINMLAELIRGDIGQ